MRLFKRKITKYEFFVLFSIDYLFNEKAQKLQNDDWELVSNICIESATVGDNRFLTATFKRKLNHENIKRGKKKKNSERDSK